MLVNGSGGGNHLALDRCTSPRIDTRRFTAKPEMVLAKSEFSLRPLGANGGHTDIKVLRESSRVNGSIVVSWKRVTSAAPPAHLDIGPERVSTGTLVVVKEFTLNRCPFQ
jgi:hypothetical protein